MPVAEDDRRRLIYLTLYIPVFEKTGRHDANGQQVVVGVTIDCSRMIALKRDRLAISFVFLFFCGMYTLAPAFPTAVQP